MEWSSPQGAGGQVLYWPVAASVKSVLYAATMRDLDLTRTPGSNSSSVKDAASPSKSRWTAHPLGGSGVQTNRW